MLSIILPTYNESENIIDLIDAICKHAGFPLEIIVVDDDSPDLTWKIARDYNNPYVKVIRRTETRGLSTAIQKGLQGAKGDIVGWMDADMGMPPSALPEMIEALRSFDVVIGSRYIQGGKDMRGFTRVITSRMINCFAGIMLGFSIKDYDSGFIVLKRPVLDKVSFPAGGYGEYFIELVFRCKNAGFKIKEIPYTFRDREKGKSKTAATFFEFFKLGAGYILKIISIRFKKRG